MWGTIWSWTPYWWWSVTLGGGRNFWDDIYLRWWMENGQFLSDMGSSYDQERLHLCPNRRLCIWFNGYEFPLHECLFSRVGFMSPSMILKSGFGTIWELHPCNCTVWVGLTSKYYNIGVNTRTMSLISHFYSPFFTWKESYQVRQVSKVDFV